MRRTAMLLLAVVASSCARGTAPSLAAVDGLAQAFNGAAGRRRVVALVSPS